MFGIMIYVFVPIATLWPSLMAVFLPWCFHKLSLLLTKTTHLWRILEHTLQITLASFL